MRPLSIMPVWIALRPEKSCSAMSRRRMAANFAVGGFIAYLGDLSIYHVRLKSGQMIRPAWRERNIVIARQPAVMKCVVLG